VAEESRAPAAPVTLRVGDLPAPVRMYIHGPRDRCVSSALRDAGIWEPFETRLVLGLLAPGSVFLDVGANIGYFTLLAARAVGPGGRVFAFEPEPENFRLLQANLALNEVTGQVHAVMAGLSDADTDGRLYLSEDNLGDHQLHPADTSRGNVPVSLLHGSDYLCGRAGRFDVVKVDVQGAEYAVMAGLLPLLQAQGDPLHILLELSPAALRRAGHGGRKLIDMLAGLGHPFWIVDHLQHRLAPTSADELSRWCDNVEAVAGDEGFMNILIGRHP
jgi:FkbM family methyltransferase